MEFLKVFKNRNLDLDEKVRRITALLEDGADPNEPIYNGYDETYLLIQSATIDATGKLLRVFLEYGAIVDLTNKYGMTALTKCVDGSLYKKYDNSFTIVISRINILLLVQYGADINMCIKKSTPSSLHLTSRPFVVKLMLDAGANGMSKTEYGDTQLGILIWKLGNEYTQESYVEYTMSLDLLIEAI